MDLIIDKANILSLLSSKKLGECSLLIQKGINIIFNMNKEDLSEDEKLKIAEWLKLFTDGRKNYNISWRPILDTNNLKTNFTITDLKSEKKSFRYAYLIDNEKVVDFIKEKGNVLIGKVGEEQELILSLKLEDTEIFTYKIKSWDNYCPSLPVTDIIICDNYYFKKLYTYQANDNELIKALCRNCKQSPINLILITKSNGIDSRININEEQKKLEKLVKQITSSNKSNACIVLSYSSHDRHVITNYFRINNGTGFHLKKEEIKKNILTEIKSHAYKNNQTISDDLISEYKEIINKNASSTYGEPKCNFF